MGFLTIRPSYTNLLKIERSWQLVILVSKVVTGNLAVHRAAQPKMFRQCDNLKMGQKASYCNEFLLYPAVVISVGFVEHMHEQSVPLAPLSNRRLLRLVNNFINGAFTDTWRHISFTGPFGSSYSKKRFT